MGRSRRKFRRSISPLSALFPHPEHGSLSVHIWQGCAHLEETTPALDSFGMKEASHRAASHIILSLTGSPTPQPRWQKRVVKSCCVLKFRPRPDCRRLCGCVGACHPTAGRGGPSPPPTSLLGLPHSLPPPKYAHYILATAGPM